MNGRRLYLNGFNAYWLMNMGVDPSTRGKVTTTFQQASKEGMNVARAWAFSDGGYGSLQSSPGSYNENVFKDWITEMAAYVKSIDKNHLLEIGLEGFYGDSTPEKKQFNPGYQVGTDFISNNRIPGIDFTTIHLYPDQWVPGSDEEARAAFVEKWIQAHIQDSKSVIQKPILLSEFGKSSKSAGYSVAMRDNYFQSIYNTVYTCARTGGPCGGGLFWQLLAPGMDNFRDGYEVVLEESPSTASGQSTGHANGRYYPAGSQGFIKTSGTQFVKNGRRLNLNGFNAYWLMYMASDPETRAKVTNTFQQASKEGMNIARTWAFSDGGSYRPLQSSPGTYNPQMFQGLDFVISEARKYGIYLILSLVNNWEAYGGKKQYVQWARDRGQSLNNDDDFFTSVVVKGYYKNHVKDWIREMATHVKSIDGNHLLEIGLEGFYGESRKQNNPGNQVVGTDFISNNQIPGIDFATIHLYPEQWMQGSNKEEQSAFVEKWIRTHIADSNSLLKKPLLLTEFGKSSKSAGYSVGARDEYYRYIYNTVFGCAESGGPLGGGLFWQLMASGMDSFRDGYEVVLDECPSTAAIIHQQSRRLSAIN
ncbi:hypothetical protein RHSIM_Rhsim01G0197400 [Rhododendron simsii]|uniref:mannan endo-1,4-beta-mannosidase n=1 Tax=Rhododendron simsii TaxID=118357 RepID=A0A834M2D3_RHOSS|nr:hypothetical protein RHSIM_Rhsim01G0197400 [Rhododendron simsii]